MLFKNTFNFINYFFSAITFQLKKIYLTSSIYNRKISKIGDKTLDYKPSQNLIFCIINYPDRREKIDTFNLKSIWLNKKLKSKNLRKLHNFFWLFSLDLKSSKFQVQDTILQWIGDNENYSPSIWEIDTLSRRIISWLSNSKLTYEDSNNDYKVSFDYIIKKQINHLINQIEGTNHYSDKLLGCCAIVLVGLSYKDERYLNFGLSLLHKIIKLSFSEDNFPKTRSVRQSLFYLKHFILIREFLKEAHSEIPEYLDEIIYYLGQNYKMFFNDNEDFLFNGNINSNNKGFQEFLISKGYKFNNIKNDVGGYVVLRNKNFSIAMDVGPTPDKRFSNFYQSGTLSFELYFKRKKLITNSGYFQDRKHQLHLISKSTAAHSTAIIDNSSICGFKKRFDGESIIKKNVKILKKNYSQDKNIMNICASHDGYLKNHGIIHQRDLTLDNEKVSLIGSDIFFRKKNYSDLNYEIRFHLNPLAKVTKTQDQSTLLIELDNSGWKFSCDNSVMDIENGLYFGNKNIFTENQNICLYGNIFDQKKNVVWRFTKV